MSVKNAILRYNPINLWRMYKCKTGLRHNITIFASNCMGGLLYHDYGRKFLSPTVNTRFDTPDFIRFICNVDYYLAQKLRFLDDASEPFPVAMLDDVKIYFVHYHTNEEAEKKWIERTKRIDWNNVFVLTNDNDGVTEKDIIALDKCKFLNILVFSAKSMPQYRCTFQLMKFAGKKEVGNTMKRNILTGHMAVQKEFDFTAWFNQDKGNILENYRI